MEFSYRVSEKEYRAAWGLQLRRQSGSRVMKIIMFWVFILVCLLMLWTVVSGNPGTPKTSNTVQTSDQSSDTPESAASSEPIGQKLLVQCSAHSF